MTPTIVSTGTNANKSGSNISLTMPTGLALGRLLLLVGQAIDSAGFDIPGWESVCSVFSGSGASQAGAFRKISDGSDTANMVMGSGTSKQGAALIYQFDGWSGVLSEVIGTAANGGATTAAPDPPSRAGAPPLRDNRWIATGSGSGTPTMTAPSSYTLLGTALYNASASTLAVADRSVIGQSQDPGVFGGSLGNPCAMTIVVPGPNSGLFLPYF